MPLTFNFGEDNRPELFEGKPKTPVTLLSGFLGTGKTSLLKHLLQNQEGVRIGVVVNDVAAVNIDSQLVRRYEKGFVEVTELQNGCVCCSSADDLFSAVQNIVMRSKDHPFEHIVVELSGVGEPDAVKRNWAIGLECTMPVALRTEVKRVVTVVDASTFGRDWLDNRQAQERNEDMRGDKHDEKNKARLENVGQLLAEQVEWADVVVVNKVDLASSEELTTTEDVVHALNKSAPTHHASHGKLSPSLVLPPVPRGLKTIDSGKGDGYTWAQTPAEVTVKMPIDATVKGRDIDFRVGKQTLKLGIKRHPSAKIDGKLSGEIKDVEDVVFEIEDSGSGRQVVVTLEKRRSGMWGDLLHHESQRSESEFDDNQNSQCYVAGGSVEAYQQAPYQKHQQHRTNANRAQERFGIHSFTYQRRRPFKHERLQKVLAAWPILKKELFSLTDLLPDEGECEMSANLRPVLRSKGFCWVDNEPLKQHVWAQAGKTLVVSPADWWWSCLDKEQVKFKVTYPGVEAEYKEAKRDKWDPDVGDKRQELVFIGGPQMQENEILQLLDNCLLSEDEYSNFKERMSTMTVPNDDFHVQGLLKNLGATKDEIKEMNATPNSNDDAERRRRKLDEEETDFLRELGVGSALEPEDSDALKFESID